MSIVQWRLHGFFLKFYTIIRVWLTSHSMKKCNITHTTSLIALKYRLQRDVFQGNFALGTAISLSFKIFPGIKYMLSIYSLVNTKAYQHPICWTLSMRLFRSYMHLCLFTYYKKIKLLIIPLYINQKKFFGLSVCRRCILFHKKFLICL